jgi:hypothetical protein
LTLGNPFQVDRCAQFFGGFNFEEEEQEQESSWLAKAKKADNFLP